MRFLLRFRNGPTQLLGFCKGIEREEGESLPQGMFVDVYVQAAKTNILSQVCPVLLFCDTVILTQFRVGMDHSMCSALFPAHSSADAAAEDQFGFTGSAEESAAASKIQNNWRSRGQEGLLHLCMCRTASPILSGRHWGWWCCFAVRATPLRRLRHLQRALGIIPTANKTGNSLLLDSLLFHTPPLCTVQYVPWGLFFLFLTPPPPC